MRSGERNFSYFPENQLTKLAHFVQFKRVLMPCLGDSGRGAGPLWLRHCLELWLLPLQQLLQASLWLSLVISSSHQSTHEG